MELELSSFPLAVFTTLAPAGMAAFVLMALARIRCADPARWVAADALLGIPFMLVLSGFITATAHLGTPANALYVVLGVGRSPLSNEVASVLAFLFLSGSYVMATLFRPAPRRLACAWLLAACAAAAAGLWFTARAYSVPTIPAWNLPHMPLALAVGALGLGALLTWALLGRIKGLAEKPGVYVATYALSCVAVCVLLALYARELGGVSSFYAGVAVGAGEAFGYVLAYALLSLAALGLALFDLRRSMTVRPHAFLCAASVLLALLGCMAARYLFYASYLTIGL